MWEVKQIGVMSLSQVELYNEFSVSFGYRVKFILNKKILQSYKKIDCYQ